MEYTEKNCWVIIDSRKGNANQAIGLAEALNIPFEIKEITYNFLANLPNNIIGKYNWHVNLKRSDLLTPPFPQLIISSGRRIAPIATRIKSQSPSTKIIQLLRPYYKEKLFDLIILPQHDIFLHKSANIFRTIGAINQINPDLIHRATGEFKKRFLFNNDQKVIAVFIGGNNKKFQFSKNDSKILTEILENLYYVHGAQLYITFSRRTPKHTKKYITQAFGEDHFIYDPIEGGYNPYHAMLGLADYIITTSDSISMCSEAASSGKPLYIYSPKSFNSPKHKYFLQQLVDLGIARKLSSQIEILEHYTYSPLNEGEKVAEFIREYIL